ncbi:hypothetical protein [Methylobacterium goesingense]|uniref:Uncharacterized protein n=1 Tax=Methylobacterium goesingense TaxID=243690 RepID=A0ABV2L1K1_9HYPH|nr:hypothetical protein [Methylobacterium goesingense]GJD72596.1 hypothetical protein CFIICLFH_0813 [Methylobacterium goesingense]
MSLAALLARGPFSVRPGRHTTVEDRHGESAFVVLEPQHFPEQRRADAQAWAEMANAEIERRNADAALPQAAE